MEENTNEELEQASATEENLPPKKVSGIDKFFGVTASGSTIKTEIVAGLTTFMAMVYILMVNAGMFSEAWVGLSYGAAYIATAIGAVVGTLLMSLYAKMPLAQASGMGVNAFIVYTLLLNGTGLTYANCMVFTLLDGVIFVVLTVTGLRKKLFEAIPASVRHAIPVGIGMFIAFIGLQQAGVIVNDDSTLVKFVSFNVLSGTFVYGNIVPAIVAIVGVLAIAVMSKKNVKGAILWGILGSTVLFYILAAIGFAVNDEVCVSIFSKISFENPFLAFKDWGTQAVGKVFIDGFNFSGYSGGVGGLIVLFITTALSLCMIDMFDTIGTLYGACAKGNLLDEKGTPLHMEKMMLADAVATCAGAIAGTSTVTTFVESSAGVAAGGKTGLTSLVTTVLFFIAMFLSPIAQLIPRSATATALVWVGVLMMTNVTKIEWTDAIEAAVGFITFIVMLLGYSISKGIGAGIIAYVVLASCSGKIKEISIVTWIVAIIFLLTFIFAN